MEPSIPVVGVRGSEASLPCRGDRSRAWVVRGAVTVAGGERRGRRASLPGEERQRVDGGETCGGPAPGQVGRAKEGMGKKFSCNDFSWPNSCPPYPYLCFFSSISFLFLSKKNYIFYFII